MKMGTVKIRYILLLSIILFKFSFSETVDELIELAKKNNPDLKRLEKEIEVLKQKVKTAGRIPNPTFSFNFQDRGSFRVSQYIPWYEKLSLQREIEEKRYESQLILQQQEKNKIVRQIREAVLSIWFYRERIKINSDIIGKIEYILDKDITPTDRSKLLILKTDFLLENKDLEILISKQISDLKVLLNNNFTDVVIDKVDIPQLDEINIKERVKTVGLAIRQIEKQIERDRLSYKLAKEIYVPDLGISLTYKTKEKLEESVSASVNLYLNVPIWRRLNQEQIVLEQKLQLIAAQERRVNVINQALWSLEKYIQEYRTSLEKLDILKKSYDVYKSNMDLTIERYLKKEEDINSLIYSISRFRDISMKIKQEVMSVNSSYLRAYEMLGELD